MNKETGSDAVRNVGVIGGKIVCIAIEPGLLLGRRANRNIDGRLADFVPEFYVVYTSQFKVLWISMAARETNPNFMNGVSELLILRLLREEEMYGYEIVQAIRSRTDSVIAVGEGVVYPVLHGLERDGALRSRRRTVNGRSRIYYSVTAAGLRRLAGLSETWTSLASAIQKMLTGGQYVEAIL